MLRTIMVIEWRLGYLQTLLLTSTLPIGQKDGLARELLKETCEGSLFLYIFAPNVVCDLPTRILSSEARCSLYTIARTLCRLHCKQILPSLNRSDFKTFPNPWILMYVG